jgi:hypothetical protein
LAKPLAFPHTPPVPTLLENRGGRRSIEFHDTRQASSCSLLHRYELVVGISPNRRKLRVSMSFDKRAKDQTRLDLVAQCQSTTHGL